MSDFMRTLCKIAIPVTLQGMLQASFSIVDQVMIGQLGEAGIAAVGLCGNFTLIFSMMSGAVGTVAGILIAQFLGAEEHTEAWRSLDVSLVCGGVLAALFLLAAGLVGAVAVSALVVLLAGPYTGWYRVAPGVKRLGSLLLVVFALYAPIKVENMILGGGILRSGGNTGIILVIDCLGTWCVGIPLCLLAAYGLRWGIVGVYALLNAEEAFRLVLSLVMFRRRSWMVSLSEKQRVP